MKKLVSSLFVVMFSISIGLCAGPWNVTFTTAAVQRKGVGPAAPIEVSKIRLDSQSTAETIIFDDGNTDVLVVYVADDGNVEIDFDPYLMFYTSMTIRSDTDTTPSRVSVNYRQRVR